jgi:hypothetical protein
MRLEQGQMWSSTKAHLTLYHPIEHHGGLPEKTDIDPCWEHVIYFGYGNKTSNYANHPAICATLGP